MKKWQYALNVILTTPEQFPASEAALNELGRDGWEAVTALPLSGVTGMGKAAVLFRREVRSRRPSASARAA